MWYFVGALAAYFLVMLFLQARFMRRGRKTIDRHIDGPKLPGISVIRPVKGLDYDAESIHRTIFEQDYPNYEIIFSLQDPKDPALPLLHRLVENHPNVDAKVIVNPLIDGISGKVSNMIHGLRTAKYDTVVFCDSDIPWNDQNTLRKLVAPLQDPDVGASTLIPVGVDSHGFWGKLIHLFTLMFSFQALMLVVISPKPKSGLVGGTFATRLDVLNKIGGLESYGVYAAEDLAMGRAIGNAGYYVHWIPEVSVPIGSFTFDRFYQTLKRWTLAGSRTFKLLWFISYLCTYGYIWGLVAGLTIAPGILPPMIAIAALRIVGYALVDLLVFPKSRATVLTPLTPVIDVLMAIWTPLFLVNPVIVWRGVRYRVGPGAVMERLG